MRLHYITKEGHFNYSNPSEVSYSCHVAVYDDDGSRIKYCNITPEYELNGTDVEEIIGELEASMKRYWSTGDNRKEMVEFLTEHQEEIETGNMRHELIKVNESLEKLQTRKEQLEKYLGITN